MVTIMISSKDGNIRPVERKYMKFNCIKDGFWELRYNEDFEEKINYNPLGRVYSDKEVSLLINEIIGVIGDNTIINAVSV